MRFLSFFSRRRRLPLLLLLLLPQPLLLLLLLHSPPPPCSSFVSPLLLDAAAGALFDMRAEGGGGVLKCPAVRFSCVARANKLLRTLLARSRSPLRFDVGDGLDEQPNMLTCRDQMVHVR